MEEELLEPSTPAAENIMQEQADIVDAQTPREAPGTLAVWNNVYFQVFFPYGSGSAS